jgi:tetratricopeptide (TPR) repeat protein
MPENRNTVQGFPDGLSDRYRVEGIVGRGGFAIVYRATDLKHHREVAIKILRVATPVALDRFQREIAIVATLQHPNILPLFDSGTTGPFLYFVMPCVQGGTLRDRLNERRTIPTDEAIEITRQVALGLEVAHQHGVIHRDVKPENIMLYHGEAAIADFGLAWEIDRPSLPRVTDPEMVAGTPEYMSPEQLAGKEIDERSDVYALACVLFEMLDGDPPFTHESPQVVLSQQLTDPPPWDKLRGRVPPFVFTALRRALVKAPGRRLASPARFRAALAGQSGATPPKARRVAAAAVSVIALLLVALIFRSPSSAPPAPADPNGIVVFPLVHRGQPDSAAMIGYDVALVIEAALERAQPLKWIDGWERLDVASRRDPTRITAARARSIALDQRAGFYMTGTVFDTRDSTNVTLRLWDAVHDSLVAQHTAAGPSDRGSVFHLGLEAVVATLPELIDPERAVSVRDLQNSSADAIALWIQGERRYRLARFDTALTFFERALQEDPNLTPAAFKAALAADWLTDAAPSTVYLSRLVSNLDALSPRHRHFARALAAYARGDGAAAAMWADSALETDPTWAEAATLAGEIHHHLIPSPTAVDSVARTYFERARSMDSAFYPPTTHLAELAARRGDLDAARYHVSEYEAAGGDPRHVRHLELFLNCDDRGTDWQDATTRETAFVLSGARMTAGTELAHCAIDALHTLLAEPTTDAGTRWGAFLVLQGQLLAEGRWGEAEALIDSATAAGASRTGSLFMLGTMAGAPWANRAQRSVTAAERRFGVDYRRSPGPQAEWLLGSWYGLNGQLDRARAVSRSLSRRAATSGDPRDGVLASAIAAEVDLLAGDTTSAVRIISSLTPMSAEATLAWEFADALPRQYLRLAEILFARGEYEEAIRVASVFDHPYAVHYLSFLPMSLLVRYDASRALGNVAAAEQYRKRLLGLGRVDLLDR